MDRRKFLYIGMGLSLTSLIPERLLAKGLLSESSSFSTLKPARLHRGDKVGLVAPAFLITEKDLQLSIERIKQLGLEPVYSDNILGRHGYFSGTDRERADEFNRMIGNPAIRAIIFTSGGYGCARMLDLIDYDLIRRNPKLVMGFSDCTALLYAIYRRTGLITFHGPISRTIHRDYNRMQFENMAMNPTDRYTIRSADNDLQRVAKDKTLERYTIRPGIAQGELTGGNLTLICSMIGTPDEMDLNGKIVMIEDVGEEPYRIDRMLTQLISGSALAKAAGIAFGVCKRCDKTEKAVAPHSFTLREVVEERIKPLGIPAVYGLSFGHNENNFPFPIGIRAELDAANQTVTLLEKAVV